MHIEGRFRAVAVPVATDDGDLYVQLGTSPVKGTPQIAANFRILEGEFQGVEVMWFGFFGDKVDKGNKTLSERTIASLRAMGFKGNDLETIESQRLDQEVSIEVQMEESQKNAGTFYPRVRFVNKLGGGGIAIARMDQANRKRFAAELKNVCKSIDEVKGAAPSSVPDRAQAGNGQRPASPTGWGQQPPASAETPPVDDDVPF